MFTRKALQARSAQRAAARKGKFSSAYWEGYWNDDETNPYTPGTPNHTEWLRGRTDRTEETTP
jgi:hypothetical protein